MKHVTLSLFTSALIAFGSASAYADSLLGGIDVNPVDFHAFIDIIALEGTALFTLIAALLG